MVDENAETHKRTEEDMSFEEKMGLR